MPFDRQVHRIALPNMQGQKGVLIQVQVDIPRQPTSLARVIPKPLCISFQEYRANIRSPLDLVKQPVKVLKGLIAHDAPLLAGVWRRTRRSCYRIVSCFEKGGSQTGFGLYVNLLLMNRLIRAGKEPSGSPGIVYFLGVDCGERLACMVLQERLVLQRVGFAGGGWDGPACVGRCGSPGSA